VGKGEKIEIGGENDETRMLCGRGRAVKGGIERTRGATLGRGKGPVRPKVLIRMPLSKENKPERKKKWN